MNTILDISEHPKFGEIKRKVELMPLTIDYRYKVANWPFQVIHTDEAGEELIEVPRANGNFRLANDKLVHPETGIKLTEGELAAENEEGATKVGVPEFEFLRGMLILPNVDPLVLGAMRIMSVDARGNFNDYAKMMEL